MERAGAGGHSTAEAAVRLADAAGARLLVGFHHSPSHTMRSCGAARRGWLPAGLARAWAREGMSPLCVNQHDG